MIGYVKGKLIDVKTKQFENNTLRTLQIGDPVTCTSLYLRLDDDCKIPQLSDLGKDYNYEVRFVMKGFNIQGYVTDMKEIKDQEKVNA